MAELPAGEPLELRDLALSHYLGELEPSGVDRLEKLLANGLSARREYIRYIRLVADLQGVPEQSSNLAPLPPRLVSPVLSSLGGSTWALSGRSKALIWTIALFINGLLVFVLALAVSPNLRRHVWLGDEQTASQQVAHLITQRDCVWRDPSTSRRDGESLVAKTLQLVQGLAEIEFDDGARVVLEGPCDFELLTAGSGWLRSGKLMARVPRQAVGFRVKTPVLDVVDLGTEFGVEVNADQTVEVHVLKGSVSTHLIEVAAGKPQTVQLNEGQALRVETAGVSGETKVKFIPPAAEKFPRSLLVDASSGSVKSSVEVRVEAGDGSAGFVFPTIPTLSSQDLADASVGKATIRAIGDLKNDDNTLPAAALLDGLGPTKGHVRFFRGSEGKFLLDLKSRVRVGQVNSYSWHLDGEPTGAPQVYELFGSESEEEPSIEGYLPNHGWRHIASVNTEKILGTPPGCPSQQGVSITGRNGPLGEFRYLLWVVLPLRTGPTFYDEIDVYEYLPK